MMAAPSYLGSVGEEDSKVGVSTSNPRRGYKGIKAGCSKKDTQGFFGCGGSMSKSYQQQQAASP